MNIEKEINKKTLEKLNQASDKIEVLSILTEHNLKIIETMKKEFKKTYREGFEDKKKADKLYCKI